MNQLYLFALIVNSCNVDAFYKMIFNNEFDLFWTTTHTLAYCKFSSAAYLGRLFTVRDMLVAGLLRPPGSPALAYSG